MTSLITLLADGKFHSKEELSNTLNISQSAIWKQIKNLEQETNLVIQSINGEGYQLESPLSLLNTEQLKQQIINWPLLTLPHINSTNTECFRLLKEGKEAPFAITAEQQTAGKGRRGKEWVSPYGQNIYYSLLIALKNDISLDGLSLTVGLAVLKALKKTGLTQVGLKWPNDILVNGKKLCGILLELHGNPADTCHVVIGIGINVNMQKSLADINQPWTSLRQELKKLIDRNELLVQLNNSLVHYLKTHFKQGFKSLKTEWQENNLWQDKIVNLLQGNQEVIGVMLGVDDTGALTLLINNEIQHFNAGEVSLRLASSLNNQS